MDVPTKVIICRPWKADETDMHWGTEPSTIVTGIHTSRRLIPEDRLHDIPIQIINVTSKPVTLSSGTKVADLLPVTIIKDNTILSMESTRIRATKQDAMRSETVPSYIEELLKNVDPPLPESTILALKSMLMDYQDLFSKSEVDLGLTDY